MIFLDTNFLIRCLIKESEEAKKVLMWLNNEDSLATSCMCWYEFLCCPVTQRQSSLVLSILDNQIYDLTAHTSQIAAQLWNAAGRNRGLKIDVLIAASALEHNALLATSNISDFEPFVPFGLKLV